ncbi:MAG: hypothetical protein ACX939_00425 [Hyphococcus sp.]
MSRLFIAAVVIAAFAVEPAAARIGSVATISESGQRADADRRGLAAMVFEQVRISVVAITGQAGQSDDAGRKFYYAYGDKESCETLAEAAETDADAVEAESEKAVGPEPLYFGF